MIETWEPSNKSMLFSIFWRSGQKNTCSFFYCFEGSNRILEEKLASSLPGKNRLAIGASDRLL